MAAMTLRGIRKGVVQLADNNNDDGSDNTEDLLVFGYSCKLFRDDEKAAYIDQGKHLIPWMGDAENMIDRYDGRGYVHDLRDYEVVAGHDCLWEKLSPDERHLESVLDEERYAALKGDPDENYLYHEEEIKRLNAALADDGVYNQVGFSYDNGNRSTEVTTTPSFNERDQSLSAIDDSGRSPDDIDDGFVPAKELNVPSSMQVPSSSKANAIIERTALFVVRQGAQMEILIKAKQAANSQFAFLAFDHKLNPYYKHVVQMVKLGKYIPKPPAETNESSDDDDDDDGHYLHPSLMSAKEEELTVPKLNYTRTGDDPYSLLVSRLKDKVEMDVKMNCPQPLAVVQPPVFISGGPPPPPPPPGLEPVTLPGGNCNDIADSSSQTVVRVEVPPGLVMPPPDVLSIVDKMAIYVAKNGEHFEAVVRSKSLDARFDFLNPGHPYHAYYVFKRTQSVKDFPTSVKTSLEVDSSQDAELKAAGGPAAVSFSIKIKEGGEKRRTFTDTPDIKFVSSQILVDFQKPQLQLLPEVKEPTEEEKQLKAKLAEARLAEQRIRDKLAAAARERLAQASREKQLQMERKRKAALFLNMLRKDSNADVNEDEPSTMIGPRLPTTVEMTQMIMREDSPPILALVAAQVESKVAAKASRSGLISGQSKGRDLRRRSRSRSPRVRRRSSSPHLRRRRRSSRSESKERIERRRLRHERRANEELAVKRSHSPRTSKENHRDHHHHHHHRRRKLKTPPAAYSTGKTRSSRSPHRHSRSERPASGKHKSRSRSRSHRRSRSRTDRIKRGDHRRRSSSTSSSSTASSQHSRSSSSSSLASSIKAASVVSSASDSCATVSSGSSIKSPKSRASTVELTAKTTKGRSPTKYKSKKR